MVQFRMLNRSKGPAMWSPRTQNDRARFAEEWRLMLERTPNVHFWQDMVAELITEPSGSGKRRITGVRTGLGMVIPCRSVVLTSGTFMNGVMHIGERQIGGGRAGEKASKGITEQLVQLGFEAGRMKTGTPPRVDGRSIDYSVLEEQPGDPVPGKFSYLPTTQAPKEQMSCWITYTNAEVHDILRTGFDRSPMSVSYTHLDVYKRQEQDRAGAVRDALGAYQGLKALRPKAGSGGVTFGPHPPSHGTSPVLRARAGLRHARRYCPERLHPHHRHRGACLLYTSRCV